MSRDPSEWGTDIPGRPADWPPLEPIDPERGRELARECSSAAGQWARSGQPELARSSELKAAAWLAEVEAIEAGDEEAWIAAVAAGVRAHGLEADP